MNCNEMRFLGELAEAPVGHLKLGFSYYDTINGILKVWTGSAWTEASTGALAPSGANDDVNIQAAIDDLSSGGVVELAEGTFSISNAITIPSNVVLKGQGPATVLAKAAVFTDSAVVIFSGASYASVRDLKIDGSATPGAINGIEVADDCAVIKIDNCHVFTSGGNNILDNGAQYVEITNNVLSEAVAYNVSLLGFGGRVSGNSLEQGNGGIELGSGADNTKITDNVISYLTTNAVNIASDNNLVSDNHITSAGASASEAIFITGQTNSIVGNKIDVPSGFVAPVGIYFEAANNTTIADNSITSVENDGLTLGIGGGGENFLIANNSVVNLDGTPTGGSTVGVYIISGLSGSITGNSVDFLDAGVVIEDCLNIAVSGCKIRGCTIGISVAGVISSCSISGNSLSYCQVGLTGSDANFKTSLSITGNVFDSCSNSSLEANSFRYCSIIGNTFLESKNDISSALIFNVVSGTNYPQYNTVNGNTFRFTGIGTAPTYNIREETSDMGPNVIVGNTALGASTGQISTQHGSSVSANNLTT